jgi:PAS domain S-box-containing protein
MIGKSAQIVNPKDRAGEVKAMLTKISTGQAIEHMETVRVRKDGTTFPVSATVSPIRDPDGVVIGASVISRDVTVQRRAYEAARSMIESSLDAFVAISPEGMITDANEATVELTGVSRDKLIGTSFSDYFTDPAKAERIYQLVFTEGMAVDYPLTVRKRDGHDKLTEVRYNATVYRDTSGKVLGVFAAARDVTNQMEDQRRAVVQQAKELERLAELEHFQRLTVGRELRMIELKKEIEYLRKFGPPGRGEPSHED